MRDSNAVEEKIVTFHTAFPCTSEFGIVFSKKALYNYEINTGKVFEN